MYNRRNSFPEVFFPFPLVSCLHPTLHLPMSPTPVFTAEKRIANMNSIPMLQTAVRDVKVDSYHRLSLP